MKYALENIETLILKDLNPDNLKIKIPATAELAAYINKITEEKAMVRSMLLEEVFSLKKERSVELLIQHYQVAIIHLADELNKTIAGMQPLNKFTQNEPASVIGVYRHISTCLEDLLNFIATNFNRYFNLDEKITDSYKHFAQSEFRSDLRALIRLFKNSSIEEGFLTIITNPFRDFLKAGSSKKITYRQLLYLKTLHKEQTNFLLSDNKRNDQKALKNLMVYVNFNSHHFINYCTGYVLKELSEIEVDSDKIEKLAWWLKTVSQWQTKPLIAYKSKDPSAKEQLLGWLTDEMVFLEKRQQLITTSIQAHTPNIPTQNSSINIKTTLSVKQVALFTRLLVDSNIIKTENVTSLLSNLSAILSTERMETISSKNLRAKYYDNDEPTKSILKDQLINMVNLLRKY